MLTKINFINLFLISIFIFGCNQESIKIFVSPDGNSKNSGTEELPLNNLEEALHKAREVKGSDNGICIEIKLLPGEYHLEKPIHITSDLNSLSIVGSGTGNTYLKGSKVLNLKWYKYKNNIWVADVDEKIEFDQLFINGRQQILARYPDYDENGGHWQGHVADVISPGRINTWKNPVGAIVHIMHKAEWGDFHYVIDGIDENGEAILKGGHQNNRPENGLHKEYRMVENVFEELDSPGEYFYNLNKQKLYYQPQEGIDLSIAKIEVSVLKHLIELHGTIDNPVQNIKISEINFSHTKRTMMENYEKLLRSDWAMYRGGAVLIEGAKNCEINDCEFVNLGGNAIFVNKYNRNIQITGNYIHEIGATSISFVGDTSSVRSPSFYYYEFVPLEEMDTIIGPKNDLYPAECIVSNNLIHRTGRIEKQTTGVQISMAMDITVSHNSIYDMPRAGINISEGTWGGHIIEFNDIFNTVLETGDHGSFNSWGRDRFWHPNRKILDSLTTAIPDMPKWDAIHTTIIRNNRLRCDHGWDIDLDDGSSNYHIYNNLCLNGGIKLREGFFRTVENNIMINNGFHPHVWFKNSGDVFRKNILMTNHKDIHLRGWGKKVDFNLFPTEDDLNKAHENNTDANSIYGNPLFKNPEQGDFSVEENSPALKLGFENFSMEGFGVRKPELKALAKQPDIPDLHISEFQKEKIKTRNWLGAKIKNVETLGERSVAGLEKEEGILIFQVEKGSLADLSGLQKGDVIVKCEDKIVKSMDDLLSTHQGSNWLGHLNLIVFRNQKENRIRINTK